MSNPTEMEKFRIPHPIYFKGNAAGDIFLSHIIFPNNEVYQSFLFFVSILLYSFSSQSPWLDASHDSNFVSLML